MKRAVLYPFLFILYIILTPLVNNLDNLDPSQALRPLWVLCLGAVGGILLFYLLTRDWQYAGYLVFLIILYFFAFGYLNRLVQELLLNFGKVLIEEVFLAICTVVLGVFFIKRVWVRLGGRTRLTPFLNLLVGILLLFPIYELISGWISDSAQAREENTRISQAEVGELVLNPSEMPDIYYIIVDGYGRADMLQELFEFDNQRFIEYLKRKGFYVAEESYTNYIQTIYSIPAGLNFNYIDPPETDLTARMYFADLARDNQIMSVLKSIGYKIVSIESGFYYTDHFDTDIYLANGMPFSEFENLLIADSPMDVLADELSLEPPARSYEAHRQRVLYAFEQLGRLGRTRGPKFVFAHIVSPHPPFVFDSSGGPLEPRYRYYIGDGEDYQGTLEEYLEGYPAQVQFVNQKLEQMIDSILENSRTPPVIIIQGDHGPGSRLVWDKPKQTCLYERTAILNAYYLPGDADALLYPSISPVNSFRVVLNAYFGVDLPLLPDTTYFSSHDLKRQVIEITAERASRANCEAPKNSNPHWTMQPDRGVSLDY